MSQIIIPVILVFTIFIAGAFAFTPVDQASTVHEIVMANAQRIDQIILSNDAGSDNPAGTGGEDLVITCPTGSDGCRILEVYFEEESGAGDITLGTLNAVIDDVAYVIQIDLGTTIDDTAEAIAGLSGVTFGGDDTITIVIADGGSLEYNAVIFIQTEGNTVATAIFQ